MKYNDLKVWCGKCEDFMDNKKAIKDKRCIGCRINWQGISYNEYLGDEPL